MTDDKKQQENLKKFDRTLRESTGQLTGVLVSMFAAAVLMVGFVLLYDGIDLEIGWAPICYICVIAWLDTYILMPYCWSNESFSKRNPQSDSVAQILKYVPLARKNYIRVRMKYLWSFIWKFAAFAMLIVIGIMCSGKDFSMTRIVEAMILFLFAPMVLGYIGVKLHRFAT